ncbi:FAD-binding and (Fe-S)-binding domain-containing protein [Helicobacter sp. 11S02629-2]|uniref:FAD-binding and (Fe-S)-binding domain-containing protein n=1 Tax=Helicobacter sp. 11S02629-2 TaxID=1476195 RepID=UPI000BA634B3|nr:FAD-binding and (Fe-S)-binding domain-containing protein [Helicobacter sp. 11S02629-2]PAF44129.1 lactate dehydrogenase [Helicobacter sp. 11S02629-2]
MSQNKYELFYQEAKTFLDDRIYNDYLRRFAYGTDASGYRYVPELVIKAISEDEIKKIFALSEKYELGVTFKASGSSLSGQTCTDKILVLVSHAHNWQGIDVKEDHIKLSCGVIGSDANAVLKPLRKKIGPDPATIATARIGGIVNNNSSGMCCGVKQNTYHTVKSVRVILQDGTLVDTGDDASFKSFLYSHKDMVDAIMDLRNKVMANPELVALIKRKYKIKNTTGYAINALVDFSDIRDIFNHLIVGSEGTLGFLSSVKLEIVDDYEHKACGLLFYPNIAEASVAVKILAENQDIISSAEIMDYYSLKSVQNIEGMPSVIHQIKEDTACILIQLESPDTETLNKNLAFIKDKLAVTKMSLEAQYSFDANEYNQWWRIRQGILPLAGATRPTNTTVVVEDVCFEIDNFGEGVAFIQSLFKKYDFVGIIFGHVLAGNIHFVITPNLTDEKQKTAYGALIDEMAHEVARMHGSIKAEHGTGRMVAPFVELEWGKDAYEINKLIKAIFDPKTLLNPDVMICDDPNIYMKNLKEMYSVQEYIDKCMECGFCEKVCPSRDLTLTPRERITVTREIARLSSKTDAESLKLARQLKKEYEYLGEVTCAACSQCESLCPLEIDTAQIAIHLRQEKDKKNAKIAAGVLHNLDKTITFMRFGLKATRAMTAVFSQKFMSQTSLKVKNTFSMIPYIPNYMPLANDFDPTKAHSTVSDSKVIYFTTCINRGFKPSNLQHDKRSIQEVFISLCNKAGVEIVYPPELENMCCGKPFVSYPELHAQNTKRLFDILTKISDDGRIPIVLDHSACSAHLVHELKNTHLKVYDLPFFIYKELSPKLEFRPTNEDIGVYTMCSLKKNKAQNKMLDLARLCTTGKIIVKPDLGCCGFAGDKGFNTPELNKSSLTGFKKFYEGRIKRGFGSSSTCEIGLSAASEVSWQSIAYLVDEVTHLKS